MEKDKTSVEWYGDAMIRIYNSYINDDINDHELLQNLLDASLQAKKLFLKQIIKAHENGQTLAFIQASKALSSGSNIEKEDKNNPFSLQYYKQTYEH